jgi:chemotaxis signal transduction protein
VNVLILPLNQDLYALPLADVREVVAAPKVTPLPAAPSGVRGLFNVRGEIVPLLDTGILVEVGPMGEVAYAVVIDTPSGQAGLALTGTPYASRLEEAVGPSETPGALGTYACGDKLAVLLDPQFLLAPARMGTWQA